MNRSIYLLGATIFAFLLIFQSCKKDELSDLAPTNLSQSQDMRGYNEFGLLLEKVVDKALNDDNFKIELIRETQKKPMGDYEVLLTSFLKHKTDKGILMKDILLEKAIGFFEEHQLDEFLKDYPSLIIATRGNIVSWAKGEHVPPTVFVPSDFKELDQEITATKEGKAFNLRLDQQFEDAVIAMHISERHDKFGNPADISQAVGSNKGIKKPGVNMSDGDPNFMPASCDPEPTSCTNPAVTSFEVEQVNGGLRVSYETEDFPESLCHFGSVRVVRFDPSGNSVSFPLRFANDLSSFQDYDFHPNWTYTYKITIRIHYIDPLTSELVVCEGNTMETTGTAPDALPLLESFRGENLNNTRLLYKWNHPPGFPVQQYRISRLNTNGVYEPVQTFGPNDVSYSYPHLTGDRGNHVEMKIEYRGASNHWGGGFFDRTYASFREPNQPLYYYGLEVADVGAYEVSSVGESLLFGAPEVRTITVQGGGSPDDPSASVIQEHVIFTTPCTHVISVWIPGSRLRIWVEVANGFYVPNIGHPASLLNTIGWDNNLIGSAITTQMYETDLADKVNLEETTEETSGTTLSAKLGLKLPKIGLSGTIGVESTHTEEVTVEIRYPSEDLYMGIVTHYYHDPLKRIVHSGSATHLTGYIPGFPLESYCSRVKYHINN